MARILVVEDEDSVRRLLAKLLKSEGHEVTEVEDGVAGIEAASRVRPDLVITDIIMPKKGGIVFIEELRALAPDVPVVAISGGGRAGRFSFLPEARAFKRVWTVKKPFRPAPFVELVQGILAGSAGPEPVGEEEAG